MKKIRSRKKFFRINTPMSFGILCAVLIVVLVGGIYALTTGVVMPAVERAELAKITPTPVPTETPEPTAVPEPDPQTVEGDVYTTADPETGELLTVEEQPGETDETLPLSGKTIAIDAGKSKEGTHKGVASKTYEHKINLTFAKALEEELVSRGATVVMTREDEMPVDADTRVRTINDSKADAAISIFCNDLTNSKTRGAEIFVGKNSTVKEKSETLAKAVLEAYMKATEMPCRQKDVRYDTDRSVLKKAEMPIVGLVLGQLSNRSDDANLNDTAFVKKAAKGIADGISSYLGIN